MRVLVTGTAGFIGNAVAVRLLARGVTVAGLDIVNDYYDTGLKEARLARILGNPRFFEARIALEEQSAVEALFADFKPDRIVHLAAQVGVAYSFENPQSYMQSNIVGFLNVLECCRKFGIEHLVFASSSSVYGVGSRMPYTVKDSANSPVSLYAATKKADEMMAHVYSHNFRLPITGLRLFTVYGPWGRPDMAVFKFTKAILEGRPIQVFNYGMNKRDFTYIDDSVEGILNVLEHPPTAADTGNTFGPDLKAGDAAFRLFNIGTGTPVEILSVIEILENKLGRKAEKTLLPPVQGDMEITCADISELEKSLGFRPATSLEQGIECFLDWYTSHCNEFSE